MPKADSASRSLGYLRSLGERLWDYERSVVNLIASDNAYPVAISKQPTYQGHMIQEGLLGNRPFAGAALHDSIEALAQSVACKVFKADHANLQSHSCSQANQAVYHAILSPGDTVLALNFRAGGHLTHGMSINFSGRQYRFEHYGVGNDERIDYGAAQAIASKTHPKILVCGSSSYPRSFDAQRLREIADSVRAIFMLDLSHEAGLIAGGALENPIPIADVVTMSMDKTLRGPFGAIILSKAFLANKIDRAVHPGTQSSFSIRRLTDSAHALILTRSRQFRRYATTVIENAKTLERCFTKAKIPLVTGGTDKHYLVLDVRKRFGMSGTEAEKKLERVGILTNRQSLPKDTSSKSIDAGGLRVGTAWATSRGYKSADFEEIAKVVVEALSSRSISTRGQLRDLVVRIAKTTRSGDVWVDAAAQLKIENEK